jgi:type III pantothenate kinase
MNPDVVVDVGNSAIKCGRCAGGTVSDAVSLAPDNATGWDSLTEKWGSAGVRGTWIVTSVNPAACSRFVDWIGQRGGRVRLLAEARELPLKVSLEKPDHVGIDRLLDAVAANGLRPPGRPAVVVDAGSAVTVDWIDADGTFTGGAILPGIRLMIRALHEHTALLPLIPSPGVAPAVPGTSTPAAMEVGVYWSVVGGVTAVLDAYRRHFDAEPTVYLTGGDAPALLGSMRPPVTHWPEMTLEGIRLAAEALP